MSSPAGRRPASVGGQRPRPPRLARGGTPACGTLLQQGDLGPPDNSAGPAAGVGAHGRPTISNLICAYALAPPRANAQVILSAHQRLNTELHERKGKKEGGKECGLVGWWVRGTPTDGNTK